MDKVHYQFFDAASMGRQLNRGLRTEATDAGVAIADTRVARLLLVLKELDECVAGLEDLPKNDLSELVAGAIQACGFTNPVEARLAIATVLQAIEAPDPPLLLI